MQVGDHNNSYNAISPQYTPTRAEGTALSECSQSVRKEWEHLQLVFTGRRQAMRNTDSLAAFGKAAEELRKRCAALRRQMLENHEKLKYAHTFECLCTTYTFIEL